MLWLAAHLPMLGFEIRRGADDAGQRPAVLVRDHRVVAADELARSAGIAAGSALATACGIAPELAYFPFDAELQAQRLEALARAACRFSSQVSPAPPDALLIECGGSLRLFGGREAVQEAVSRFCDRLGHEHRLALAPTPLAALTLARAGLGGRPGEPMAKVRAAPLACLGLAERELERLADMGLARVGQLLDLPADELGKRFSAELVADLDRLTGRRADPRQCVEPVERFRSRLHLADPIRGKGALLFPMRRLADELAGWLAVRRLGAGTLLWSCAAFAGPARELEVRFASPRADARSFLALTKLRLERSRLPGEVATVALRAERLEPLPPAAANLLARADDDRGMSPAELADRLAARLGAEAVAGLAEADDHRPERAWRPAPAPGSRPAATSPAPTAEDDRPLWLLDPPRPVDAKRYRLLHGPERIDAGWWDGKAVERDYFVAAAASGARCWLFRDRRRRWHLHGYFA